MSTIVTRTGVGGKGSPLTNAELDANFTNLNTDKLQLGQTFSGGTASGLLYLTANKVLGQSTALTFDGTSLNVSSPTYTSFNLNIGTGAAGSPAVGFSHTSDNPFVHLERWDGGSLFNAVRLSALNVTGGAFGFSLGSATSRAGQTFSEQVRITTTGLGVGLGGGSPERRIDARTIDENYGAATEILALRHSTPTPSSNQDNIGAAISFYGQDRDANSWRTGMIAGLLTGLPYNRGGNLAFYTSSPETSGAQTERMRITYDGRLRVNNTGNPTGMLSVSGDITCWTESYGTFQSTSMSSASRNDIVTLYAPYGNSPSTTSNSGAKWGIKFQGATESGGYLLSNKTAAIYAVSEDPSAGYNRSVGLAFHTNQFDTDHQERGRFDSYGNFLVGIKSGSHKLTVANGSVSSSAFHDAAYFRPYESNGGYAGNGSRILLGSAVNGGVLPVAGIAAYLQDGGAGGGGNGGGGLAFFTRTGGDSVVQQRGMFDQYGRFGVGTSNPTQAIDAAGAITSSLSPAEVRNTFTALGWGGECVWLTGNAYYAPANSQPVLSGGNAKFVQGPNGYGNQAGALQFVGNSGGWGFYIEPTTGKSANDVIVWSNPKFLVSNNGTVYTYGSGGSFISQNNVNNNAERVSNSLIFATRRGSNSSIATSTAGIQMVALAGDGWNRGTALTFHTSGWDEGSGQTEGYLYAPERMRITNGGALLLNNTNGIGYGGTLQVDGIGGGTAASFKAPTGGGVVKIIGAGDTYGGGEVLTLGCEGVNFNAVVFRYDINGANTIVGSVSCTSTGTAFNTSSDYRLKDVAGPLQNSGAYIDSLNPVEGTWKADGSVFVGLIAHEVQEVSRTQVATGEKDGDRMQEMNYSSPEIIANLVAEVKSLRRRVRQLES